MDKDEIGYKQIRISKDGFGSATEMKIMQKGFSTKLVIKYTSGSEISYSLKCIESFKKAFGLESLNIIEEKELNPSPQK